MWLNCCWSKMGPARLLRVCLFLLLIISIVGADLSTVERIRKHKEWLNQRRQQKSDRLALIVNQPKSNYEVANLWRYPKQGAEPVLETSANEVYPESESLATAIQQQSSTTTTPTTSTLRITTTTNGLETTPAGTTIDNTEVQTVLAATPTTATATTATATTTPTMQQQPATVAHKFINDFKTATTTNAPAAAFNTTTSRGMVSGVPEAPIINDNAVTEAPKSVVSAKTTTVRTTTTTRTSTESPPRTVVGNVSDLATSESSAVTTSTKRPNAGPRQRAYPRWGNWGKWSDCSRSCGGGVRFQQRKCINR